MKLILATRPAFLTITVVAVLLGLSFASAKGSAPELLLSGLAMLGALLAHAGANVFNDVHDAKNGTDACNTERVAPFTGGSRFIQEGILSLTTMAQLAAALFAAAALTGMTLLALTDWRLILLGAPGLIIAAAYSAPPLALMSRGMGEVAVGAVWALIVAGSDFVIRRNFDADILWIAIPFGCQAMLILLANQLPDFVADQAVGKRNWLVRWGRQRAATFYKLIGGASYLLIIGGVLFGPLPFLTLVCLLALPLNMRAAGGIALNFADPPKLRSSIILTLVSAHLFGLLLTLSLIAAPLMKSTT